MSAGVRAAEWPGPWLAALGALVAAGCVGPRGLPAPAPAPPAPEPPPPRTGTIALGQTVDGELAPGGRWDLRLELAEPTPLLLTTEGSEVDTVLTLLDAAGAVVHVSDDVTPTERTSRLERCLPPGAYVARVAAFGRQPGAVRCSAQRAAVLRPGESTVVGVPRGCDRVLCVELPLDGLHTLDTKGTPSRVAVALRLYDLAGHVRAEAVPDAEVCYVRVQAELPAGLYNLTLRSTSAVAGGDAVVHARASQPSEAIAREPFPRDAPRTAMDVRWLPPGAGGFTATFEVAQPTTVELRADGDVRLELLDASGAVLAEGEAAEERWPYGAGGPRITCRLARGPYSLRAGYAEDGSRGARVTFYARGWPYAPRLVPVACLATDAGPLLLLDGPVAVEPGEATTVPFQCDARGAYTFDASASPAAATLCLVAADGTVVSEARRDGRPNAWLVCQLEPGRYGLRVERAGPAADRREVTVRAWAAHVATCDTVARLGRVDAGQEVIGALAPVPWQFHMAATWAELAVDVSAAARLRVDVDPLPSVFAPPPWLERVELYDEAWRLVAGATAGPAEEHRVEARVPAGRYVVRVRGHGGGAVRVRTRAYLLEGRTLRGDFELDLALPAARERFCFLVEVPADATALDLALEDGTGDVDLLARPGEPVGPCSEAFAEHVSDGPGGEELVALSRAGTPALRTGTYHVDVVNHERADVTVRFSGHFERGGR